MVRPKKSIPFNPMWHFAMRSFNTTFRMHLKTTRKLVISCSGEFAAGQLSSTYRAHWSALMTESKYSRKRLEKADSDLLRFCASLRYAKVLLAKLNASISTVFGSAIFKQ